jgi:flavin-dependent thymidylate synthase
MVWKDGELQLNDAGVWTRKDLMKDERTLLRDVAFNKHSRNFSEDGANIVSPSAEAKNNVGIDGIVVDIVQGLPPLPEVAKVIWKGTNATRGVDINETRASGRTFAQALEDGSWTEMFRGGLQTAMEAFVIVFEVSGVSRTCTHQLVRSRRAGFHQQSQRAGSYTQPSGVIAGRRVNAERMPNAQGDGLGPNVRVPESVWRAMGMRGKTFEWSQKSSGRDSELSHAWQAALMWARKAYRLALESDVSYQDARYILPEGTENYIMCEYTLREFLNVYNYRACSMFSWEIVHVVREMGRLLMEQSPWLADVGGQPLISCQRTGPNVVAIKDNLEGEARTLKFEHMCTFQGWERVEGQCGFAWAQENNRTFKPNKSI